MSTNALPAPLRGVIPPMVTPLSGGDSLDLAGLERLIEHILAGGGNVHPRLLVDLYEAAVARDRERIVPLEEQLRQLSRIYRVGRHYSTIVKGLKCALSCLGICDDFMAEPFHRFREPEREQILAILRDLHLMPGAP